MDYSAIQNRIWLGYAKAAVRIGPLYNWYRPAGPNAPLSPANSRGTIRASFSTDSNFTFTKGEAYAKPIWFVLVDGTVVNVFDYLTDGSNTWFIASKPQLGPIGAVNCNRTLTVARPTASTGVGLLPYGGDISEPPTMTGWPASVLQGTRGEKGDTQLPGDVRLPWFSVLLPAVPGVQIKAFDVATDEAGQRYKIASTELTDMGWRLTASLAQT